MKKYRVLVTRETTEYALIEVEAVTPQDANEKALDAAQEGNPLEWCVSDDASGEICLGDPDGDPEEVEEG